VSIQTYGFGGGTSGTGASVSAGGFDPFVGFFNTDYTPVMIGGEVAGMSDTFNNYTSLFAGCPPAGTVTIGNEVVCGDIAFSVTLGAGDYILVLTTASGEPLVAQDPLNNTWADGFGALGQFQTCTLTECSDRTGDWAFDLTTPDPGTPTVPEPATLTLLVSGLAAAGWRARRHNR
jgi:hypothetical protein